ncbi:uncharacterized protein LOC119738559 isoform X2 [Patiria miniata]|uniref:Uncharacterized protein n=1 Tax=Patiria miniata TaxID=46514 RepID=A0A914B0G5_PATMI|nr:uncharacterized protein LOC119738559 isoform X2 [Patiria miniata]
MKVSHSADLPIISLPNSALTGVQLTNDKDYAKFTSYEARIPAETTVALRSPDSEQSVHIYYCISGKGKCVEAGSQNQREVCPDTVVALSSDVTYELTVSAEGGMRLFVVYYPDAQVVYRSLAVVRSLIEVVGTDRDIDWGSGHSRRYLVKQDGFPLGVHNTWVYPKTCSRLGYMNHIEGVYYIAGKTTYQWQDTSGEWVHATTKTDCDNGTNYLMNIHDCHVVKVHDKDAYCICIFDPVLKGNENHKFTEDGFSGYEA